MEQAMASGCNQAGAAYERMAGLAGIIREGKSMVYTPLTQKAMKIAYHAHEGQEDASGVPYIFHPMHLAEHMEGEVATCVALLHDVVEDTGVTLEQLEQEFPQEIVQAVSLLTYQHQEDYFDYIRRIRGNVVAKAVKLADLQHNSDESRLDGIGTVTEQQRERWRVKYQKARRILEES
ncbi:HD domain-containing protein [Lachnospiraceae bacterium 29-84]